MQTVTTVLDVIEDFTGRDLTPENLEFYSKLSSDELAALGEEIEANYTNADYADLPRPENDEQVFAFSAFASASQVKFSAKSKRDDPFGRRAELYSALMYLPRVAVPIEIENLSKRGFWQLEFTKWALEEGQGTEDIYETRFLEELTFFAHIRELVRQNTVILIPERFPLEGDVDAVQLSVNDAVSLTSKGNEAFYDGMILPNGHYYPERSMAAIFAARQVLELLTFCSEHGYDPAFDIDVYAAAFRAIRQNRTPGKRSRGRVVEPSVKIPKLGSVDVTTFLTARKADAFEAFRTDMDGIRKAASGQESDLDILDFAEETLTRGCERIDKELKTTTLRKVLFEGVRDLSIGLASSFITGEVNPSWAIDPWKALVSKTIETSVKQTMGISKAQKKKQGLQAVRRLYSIMLDESA